MYATSPRMDSLRVPTTPRHPVKIQPMDAGSPFLPSDDDDEFGLNFQKTLVRIPTFFDRSIVVLDICVPQI